MTKVRTLAALGATLLSLQLIAPDAAAQLRPGMGRPGTQAEPSVRFYGVAGYARLDVAELNARLGALDEPYSEGSEDMAVFGGGVHGRWRRAIIGAEGTLMASLEDAEVANERKAELSGFNAVGMLGFSLLQTDGFDFYPLIQAGFASLTLEVSERGDPSWDEVLTDPGRQSVLTTGTFYGAAGLGMDYTFSGGFFMGVRGTYGFAPKTDSWTDEEGDVLGGPEMDLSGPSVRLLLGIGGRP